MTNNISRYFRFFMLAVIVFGIAMRLAAASLGYTYDMESYALVGHIVSTGGNVYEQTSRYNYGPVWMYLVGSAYAFSQRFPQSFAVFRFGIAGILSLVDVGIFYLLYKQYGLKSGLLYYLNPLVIVLTGYTSQFDNAAILIAMLAVLRYRKNKTHALALFGISLIVKHIYFAFPIWLALREKKLLNKLYVLVIPFVLFAVSFLPFLSGKALSGIFKNVLLYKSFFNTPLWNLIVPDIFKRQISPYLVFFGGLLIAGYIFRRTRLFDALLWYGATIVIFSIAVSDQYFTILMPYAAVFPNPLLFAATAAHGLHMAIVINGGELYSKLLGMTMDRHTIAYHWQTGLFFAGYLYEGVKDRLWTMTTRQWIYAGFAVLVSLVMFFYVPSKREDSIVRAIRYQVEKGDYETANSLYDKTQVDPPFAGSRYWNKLAWVRYYIEYYRKFRHAEDIIAGRDDANNWRFIVSELRTIPRGFPYAKSVESMRSEAERHLKQL